ncbi:uncharacterized protein N7518_008346 [Penicillium psychrosexuale]|uniref:uncharacterized protein n=1 Tax=Penicillium psychrosexuale TaxID=1002107 RepID=UPI0025450815|nr:uncharacterized protein N7518_008346 [Penicillium psychrosexuale]KAJ5791335.1 hypothetical protein N7518_008346 [Penicillium psychrosexuale]
MSSASSAIDIPSVPLNNFTQTWSPRLSSGPLNLVTVTSIETQTVHPTWVYTISESGTDSSTAASVLDFLSLTLDLTPVTVTLATTTQWTIKQDITITAPDISEPPISTLIPTTSVLPSQMGVSATSESSDHHSWHSDAPSSVWIPPVPLTSSSISLSSSLPILSETATSSVSSTGSISTLASSSTAPSNSHSIPPSIGTATVADSSETSQADNFSSASSKIGTIVGSIIGGSAIMIFALLACALYMRHRRRRITTERLGLRQKLIRGDSTSSSISHHHRRYHSYPSIPSNIGPRSPLLLVIPLQQQPSNPDLSLDSMYLRGETAQDAFTNPPSAIIEISAPSRSVSLYSTSSRDAGLGEQGHWDCERAGTDSLAVPHGYLDASMMRDSMRSDPFDLDLEPPPNAHHRSSVPSIPTTWAVKL